QRAQRRENDPDGARVHPACSRRWSRSNRAPRRRSRMNSEHHETEEQNGRRAGHAIDTVHDAAVPGKETAAGFHARETLEQTLREIADDRERDNGKAQRHEPLQRQTRIIEPQAAEYGDEPARDRASHDALPGFARRDSGSKTRAPEAASDE